MKKDIMRITYPAIDEKQMEETIRIASKGNIPAVLGIILHNQFVINKNIEKLLKNEQRK